MVVWVHKKCQCKICKEENGESAIFNSITEGKTHMFIFHRIPISKAREYLEIAAPVVKIIEY